MNDETIDTRCKEFIDSMKDLRLRKNMSREDLAKKAGVKELNIERIENCIYKPNLDTLTRIAESLGVKIVLK